ncbi:hypothetical protein BDV34DRAFT_188361 [Aspergillus parasiticus]|uniref:Uncharacterized protein n=1 Tax=Aspergillus parasiticus TaxID=5067 RepID=A0A5N6DXJ6_ASPPA|nr:hypothetical protein BDV34DRAFT_188361 [Aspergillus parasiticus]
MYAHLIKHRSGFALAHVHHLIPETVTWNAWCQLIHQFQHYEDTQVAKRLLVYTDIFATDSCPFNIWFCEHITGVVFDAGHPICTH